MPKLALYVPLKAKPGKERDVADFLAGMTDNYAVREHRRLFDHTPDLG